MGRQVQCTECGKREDKERSACGWKGICQPKIRFQVVYSGCLLLFTQMLLFNFTDLHASD